MYYKYLYSVVVILVCSWNNVDSQGPPPSALSANETRQLQAQGEKKLSETIMAIIAHYKQKDPVGIPGAPIPDPLEIPPLKHSFSIGTMNFKNMKLYGLKKFRLDHVTADVAAMKVEAALTIDKLNVYGNYTLSYLFSSARGPFSTNLTNVYVKAIATMEVEKNGQLEAQAMDMDLTFKEISLNFEGLGFLASMFQGVINSVGNFIFDSIKPFILKEVNTNIRNDVNKEIRKFPQKFPNSISPFDQLVIEVRKKVRNMGYDPYFINDYNNSVGIFDIYMSHTWLTGLSSFHRTKDIKLEFRNNSIHCILEVGTQRLVGTSNWEISLIAGIMSRVGTVKFSIEYLSVAITASQTMDTRNHPVLDDIQLELGNIQIRFDGLGTVDYVIEFAVNVIPNLLRYQIMDALEKPIRMKVQEALDQVNIEKIIKENADKLDSKDGLQFL